MQCFWIEINNVSIFHQMLHWSYFRYLYFIPLSWWQCLLFLEAMTKKPAIFKSNFNRKDISAILVEKNPNKTVIRVRSPSVIYSIASTDMQRMEFVCFVSQYIATLALLYLLLTSTFWWLFKYIYEEKRNTNLLINRGDLDVWLMPNKYRSHFYSVNLIFISLHP